MSLEVGIVGGLVEALAPVADPEDVQAAVEAWLDDNPTAVTPIDDTAGIGDTDKLWSAGKTASEVATLTEAIAPLQSAKNDIGSNKSFIAVSTSSPTVSEGYYWSGVHSSTSYYYIHLTGLKKDDVVYITTSGGITRIKVRFTDAYNGNVRNDDASVNGDIQTYTVPENVDNIYCSFSVTYTASILANVRTTETAFVLNETVCQNAFVNKFDLMAGGTYTSTKDLQDISGFRICFSAKVGTFTGETRIGKAETETYGGAIGFDGTNLYEYMGDITTPTLTQAHGLTIKDYIGLVIDMHYNGETEITLSTNGGKYAWTVPYWRSQYGKLSAYSATALTDCVMSYTCEGIIKETWLYGDSYFQNTGNIRWTAYLVGAGYTNYLLNAYPGRGSATAVRALKTDLELGKTPKRIVWCLGMNDPDEEDQPNTTWLETLGEVMGICTKNNIELVLATIPNVPSLSNANKNAYVKSSGYRYIPFAAAISADESSTWYDGMLETVSGGGYGIHPTEQGALCLFNCAVSAVPELLW